MFIFFRRFVILLGFFVQLFALLFVLLFVLLVMGKHLFGSFPLGAGNGQPIDSEFGGMQLDAGGLVVGPIVIGIGLVNDGRGMGTMGRYRNNRQQDGEDSCLDAD